MRSLLTALALVAAGAGEVPAHFAPFEFLVGSCWEGTFPDGETTDEHCYSWIYDAQHIRDRHVVRGPQPPYRGETIYSWNGEEQRVVFRYWNSAGGYSDGDIGAREDGALVSSGERYVAPDGSVEEYRSVLRQLDGERYHNRTERRAPGGSWEEAWTILFQRTRPAPE